MSEQIKSDRKPKISHLTVLRLAQNWTAQALARASDTRQLPTQNPTHFDLPDSN
jgi:hypothetical protein